MAASNGFSTFRAVLGHYIVNIEEYITMKQIGIPIEHQSITLDWLNAALRSTGIIDEVQIQSFETEMLSAGQVGKVARLKLNYSDSGTSAPVSIIAKLSNPDNAIRAHMDKMNMYEKEVRFYQNIAPLINLPSPRCYYSDYDQMSGSCVLLLEDISHMRAVDRSDGFQKDDAELIIHHLAKFHAQWWNSPQLKDMGYLTPFDHMASYSQEKFQEWWPTFLEKIEPILSKNSLPESFRKLGRQYGPLLTETMSKLNQSPITILHRDIGTDNLMFGTETDDPPLMFFDWQLVGYGRGVSDVTYFMIYAVPTDVRRQEEYNLVRMYHRLLEEYGIQEYDFKQCWFDYKLAFFRNLAVAVNVIALSDTSHPYLRTTVQALLPRVIAFSEDHEVTSLLS